MSRAMSILGLGAFEVGAGERCTARLAVYRPCVITRLCTLSRGLGFMSIRLGDVELVPGVSLAVDLVRGAAHVVPCEAFHPRLEAPRLNLHEASGWKPGIELRIEVLNPTRTPRLFSGWVHVESVGES